MRAGLLGLLLLPLFLPTPASAAQAKPVKGIVCSGPTRFHCAVFGGGFKQFHKAFKGYSPPDRVVAAQFCAARDAMPVISAKRRRWPGGPGNEVFVVDVTCGRAAEERPASLARRRPAELAPQPFIQAEPDTVERRPRRRAFAPPRPAPTAFDDARFQERRRPAGSDLDDTRDRAGRQSRSANAVERERPARRFDPPPARTERPRSAQRPVSPEAPRTREPATTPEIVRETVREPVEAKPAAAPKPANDAASAGAPKPAGDAGSSARRKRYQESLTYEHF